MTFNIGENIGPYRITEQLGQGGMATVYKAYHAALDRYVALKVLHPAFSEDKTFELRFQREARVVAKLEHPHIVPVYDYAEHEHRPYLVMKFIEGETLKARIGRGPLSSEEIQKVVDSVGSALAYAHKQGILHRDIKPSNVLIATDGTMYLADFGLARIAQAGESTLSSDSIMGTPQYISPEQAMGKKDLDEGTDIYSFGVMLYELVVGQVPFNADTPFSIIHDHIYSPLPMPRAVNPKVPESVERVLLKALSKERADRYDSVDSMARAFKQAWDTAGVPMQGTALTLPKPVPVSKAASAPQASKADDRLETVAAKQVRAKKRTSPWMFIAGGGVIVLCCLFGFVAFRNGRLNKNLPTNLRPTHATESLTATLPPPTLAATQIQPASALPTLTPAPPLPPAVATAQQQVSQNPNDPDALLALSEAYWDAHLPRQAYETLLQVSDQAGQDRNFLEKAALEFSSREAWVASAALYLRVIRTYPLGGVPQDALNHFQEAAYKAAMNPELPVYLPFDSIERTDQPTGLAVRGRFALYHGNIEDARLALNQVKRLKPDFPLSVMLEAEIDIKDGRIAEARQLLTILSSDLSMPDWLRTLADNTINQLP